MKQLFVKEVGQQNAQTIVFLHASGSSSRMWQHHLTALKNDFHCIVIDLPGHGNSRDIEWTSFDEVTDLIADMIKSRSHGKPHLVGLSLGACLVFSLLEKHADLIDRVIVDGASHHPIKGYRKVIVGVYFMSYLKNTKLTAKLMANMMTKSGAPQEDCQLFIEDLQRSTKPSFRRAMSQANLLKVNANFDNPAFFVSGGEESETIHQSHQLLAGRNINSESAYYPNKGHAWLFSDVDTHIQLVRYFLQGATFPYQLSRFTY